MSRNIKRRRGAGSELPPPPPKPVEPDPAPEAPPTAASAAPAPSTQEMDRPRLDLDDLEALARMDPDQLAALMSGQLGQKRIQPGSKVTGRVTRIGRLHVFVDVGGKSEGSLDRDELPEVSLGDTVEAFVLSAGEQGIVLSLKLSGAAAAEHLEDAHASGVPVDGRVASRNPGGFEVRVGSVRAFCPISRISRLPAVDQDAYVGQTLQFRVIEVGDKIVLDRRALQEEEVAAKAEELWTTIAPGDRFQGTVRNVRDFGAFVDIGGIDGLVPRSEISWSRGADPREVLGRGQTVEVHVLEVDHDRKRLTLSCKAPDDDPWQAVGSGVRQGGVYTGTVVRIEPFGAFVELQPGLTGLAHVSRLAGGMPEVGSEVTVRVVGVDDERRRIQLTPVAEGAADEPAPEAAGVEVTGTVAQVLRNGVAVTLADGRSAWLPVSEVELPAGTVLAQRYRRGRTITAKVKETRGERVVLTARASGDGSEGAWREHVASRGGAKPASTGFGTFGDLLKGLVDKS